MNPPHLQLRQQLPESGSEYVGFRPELYYRDPREIENDIKLQEIQLQIKQTELRSVERNDESHEIEHNRRYGWYGGYKFKRFITVAGTAFGVGGAIGFVVGWLIRN